MHDLAVSRDAVPWALIYAAQNESHTREKQGLIGQTRRVVAHIVKEAMCTPVADRCGTRALCKDCCAEGLVDDEMVEAAVTTWKRDVLVNYGTPAVLLCLEQQAQWLRDDVALWRESEIRG